MPEHEAQAVVLVAAVEELDRGGELLPKVLRQRATLEARAEREASAKRRRGRQQDDPIRWLAARAVRLRDAVVEGLPPVARTLRTTTALARGLGWPLLVLALVAGLLTNVIGPDRQLNVLALPLLGLIVWNLALMVFLLLRGLLPSGSAGRAGRRPWLLAWRSRLAERMAARSGDGEDGALGRRVLSRYLSRWLPAITPLAAARGRRLLHAAALLLVLGAVLGMYVRGIGFAYSATWESTFLRPPMVDRLLGFVLGPAAHLLGTEVPSAAALEGGGGGISAAPWIHLYAVTALLFVGLPRLGFILFESLRVARLRRRVRITLPRVYVRRLRAAGDTARHRVDVLPYSYRPPAEALATLKGLLLDLFGARAEIRARASLAYGEEPASDEEEPFAEVILFGLAQTPELEVHGAFLTARREALLAEALLVIVDASLYRQRLAAGEVGEKRLAERRRAWDRMLGEVGLPAAHLDLQETPADAALEALALAVWPADALGGKA